MLRAVQQRLWIHSYVGNLGNISKTVPAFTAGSQKLKTLDLGVMKFGKHLSRKLLGCHLNPADVELCQKRPSCLGQVRRDQIGTWA